MFKKTRNKIKSRIKKSFVDSSAVKQAVEGAKEKEDGPLFVSDDVGQEEFAARYKNQSLTLYFALVGFIYCFVAAIFFEGLQAFLLSAGAGILLALIYLKTSFALWVARQVYRNWENRNEGLEYRFADYVRSFKQDYRQLLPGSIDK